VPTGVGVLSVAGVPQATSRAIGMATSKLWRVPLPLLLGVMLGAGLRVSDLVALDGRCR
jgi:hypothetical protein